MLMQVNKKHQRPDEDWRKEWHLYLLYPSWSSESPDPFALLIRLRLRHPLGRSSSYLALVGPPLHHIILVIPWDCRLPQTLEMLWMLWWGEKCMAKSRQVEANSGGKSDDLWKAKGEQRKKTRCRHEKQAFRWRGVCLFGGFVCRPRNILIGSSSPVSRSPSSSNYTSFFFSYPPTLLHCYIK